MAVLQSDGVNHTSDLILRRNGTEGLRLTSSTVQVSSINDGPLAGFRNVIINGGMQVAQRGTVSLTNNVILYGGCDRWLAGMFNFTTASGSVTQAGGVNGRVNEILATTTGTNANQVIVFQQRIESVNAFHLSGKTITISASLFHDVGSAIAPKFNLDKPNTLDNYSSTVSFIVGTTLASLASGNRVRYTFTTTLGSTDANNGLLLEISFPISSAITNKYFQISEVQIEEGPVATPFERRPIGTELALCQRYYLQTDQTIGVEGVAVPAATISYGQQYVFPSTMRTAPSVTTSTFNDNGNMNGNSVVDLSKNSVSLRGISFSGVTAVQKSSGFWFAGIKFNAEI
jgi:hypothetical protein